MPAIANHLRVVIILEVVYRVGFNSLLEVGLWGKRVKQFARCGRGAARCRGCLGRPVEPLVAAHFESSVVRVSSRLSAIFSRSSA